MGARITNEKLSSHPTVREPPNATPPADSPSVRLPDRNPMPLATSFAPIPRHLQPLRPSSEKNRRNTPNHRPPARLHLAWPIYDKRLRILAVRRHRKRIVRQDHREISQKRPLTIFLDEIDKKIGGDVRPIPPSAKASNRGVAYSLLQPDVNVPSHLLPAFRFETLTAS